MRHSGIRRRPEIAVNNIGIFIKIVFIFDACAIKRAGESQAAAPSNFEMTLYKKFTLITVRSSSTRP